ncbi:MULTISPECIES: thermostable hemolysin [Nitrospirillum]|uniref:Thermostable hemolysin n=1 Tax=Nitrospirillum amazonense TaxID=28077 RepID=A0A560G3B9_9PROT|nr:thermostable hemolysin [Nitrospirillum amazonense]MEC4591940.1 thermostable hemolysin [Nitrospirillum amazonense]TWB28334.1 thermostable hemolysin [Nitrospirillum amazonense]
MNANPHPRPVPTEDACRSVSAQARLTDIVVLSAGHPSRPAVEQLVRETYAQAYGARIGRFPRLMMAAFDQHGNPACAAGVRTTADGFFSEAYLDQPIERILGQRSGRHVHRARVFEITTLVSRRADLSAGFFHSLACRGALDGYDWCFFTATARLRQLLARLYPPLLVLAQADPARQADAAAWGRYYESAPAVCAADDWPFLSPGPTRTAEAAAGAAHA